MKTKIRELLVLTPALSSEERENHSPRFDKFQVLGRAATSSLVIGIGLFCLLFVAASCAKKESAATEAASDPVAYYTCMMHPSVHLMDPKAKCPICGMSLVPVMKNTAQTNSMADSGPSEFVIAPERQQLIGVTYAKVTKQPLRTTIRTVGTIANDKQRHWDYVSRVEGYVHKLEVSARGDTVEKDQPLLTIESPDLLVAQKEFVGLLALPPSETASKLLASARQRLNYWNVSDKQIQELEKTRQPQPYLMLYSPFKGVVQDLPVDQGRRVSPGDHIVDVADLSVVWAWVDFYQEEMPLLKKGGEVTVTTTAYPEDKFTGKISLIDPWVNSANRTIRVRLDVPNPDFKLRPDMYVDAELQIDQGEGLAIPVSAVVPTGTRSLVFVNKGNGKLEPRYVEVGRKFGDFYAVKSGLEEGDQIVNSANFLIDAEAKVQGALKSW